MWSCRGPASARGQDVWVLLLHLNVVGIPMQESSTLSLCVEFAKEHHGLGVYGESAIESSHHDVHLTFENHSNSGHSMVNKERRTQSDISQRRTSRIHSGRITPAPTPRLCHMCGRPRAKYMNNCQRHQCNSAIN